VRPGGNAGAQGGRGEQRAERLVSGERIVILVCAGFEQPVESASRSGEHSGDFVVAGWGQDEKMRGFRVTGCIPIGAVESQRVEVEVQRRAESLEEGDGTARGAEATALARERHQAGVTNSPARHPGYDGMPSSTTGSASGTASHR